MLKRVKITEKRTTWRPPASSRDPGIECVLDSNRSYVLEAGPITTVLTNYPTNLIGARICKFQEKESYVNVGFFAEGLLPVAILCAVSCALKGKCRPLFMSADQSETFIDEKPSIHNQYYVSKSSLSVTLY